MQILYLKWKKEQKMQVTWKYKDLNNLGQGVVFKLPGREFNEPVGFIDGYDWQVETCSNVIIWLDKSVRDMPFSVKTELRLAMLLFLTDKTRQETEVLIHGFQVHLIA
jgi:hypothetical protein